MKADAFKIADGVYWVGVLDWDLRDYHGYTLDGTTYNCYLVFGEEKTALIDNTYPGSSAQLWARIYDAFSKEGKEPKIDVIIQNHIENDHSGCLAEFVKKFPDLDLYCSPKAVNGLISHVPALENFDMNVVKTGDTLDIGGKTFTFLEAPMLHWPDSMFTFLAQDGILFSNDAFGQHICASERYDTDISEDFLISHAQKFYANLITPSSPLVLRKLDEVVELGLLEKIKTIAPSHGQILTEPMKLINKYKEWASGECKDKVTFLYDTMHHSTQKMAHAMMEGLISEGIQVKSYFLHTDGRSDIVTDVLDSKAIFVGSPTMMNNPYPSLGDLMYYFNALSFKKTGYQKEAVVFGSKGWGGGANRKLTADLQGAGFEVVEQYDLTYIPTEEELLKCYEIGKEIGKKLKSE
ncbi:F420H2 oxidase [Methanobrevibacter arboriphilus JCM 13429 = DSM 1125]|uniref:F420H2 oxidase n=1 Tax=Methanobrevibacter arboriphilus JCM 13429 = DSM 1125 TaxID=1300164 RepID=A0A1V6N2V6_METAZ|nr:FprA family A-type flavoprotein [Methanobrevibacter arboriphilus]OQD58932.1 F420H2 oxidase [Methanobrevibacter arboriphilus JCM 13429 = DSM 1125]